MIKRVEIGSEFEKYNFVPLKAENLSAYDYINNMVDGEYKFLISGRAAIEWIIKDILLKKKVKKAYLPSYICESVVKPFKDNNIQVEYYDVTYEDKFKMQINTDVNCDIFFAINYFGYSQNKMDKYIKEFKKKGIIVIEDITHSLLLEEVYCKDSDYVIASLRKIFPVASGGLAIKLGNKFDCAYDELKAESVVTTRIEAMNSKKKYLDFSGDQLLKDTYLKQYSKFNSLLSTISFNHIIDEYSVDVLKNIDILDVIAKRKNNASQIYKRLQNSKEIIFLFDINQTSVPIFVPIMVQKNMRDSLRQYMSNNLIYLPCHWLPEKGKRTGYIYDHELSLVVDQRYSVSEIDRMCDNLLAFFDKEREK